MFFRRFLLLVLAATSISGCSLYEGPPPARKKDFTQGSLGCLKDFSAQLTLYFDGKASTDDVNRIADCSITALRTFGELTRGENRDRFTAQEVRNFLQRYFLDDVTFSDGLLRELMRVKQALVGGKTTDFTHLDLKEAEGLINVFREICLRFQPSMPLSMERVRLGSTEYVEEEARAIADVGEILGRKITEKDSTYSFEEMGRLFDEIVLAFPGATGTLGDTKAGLEISGVLKEMLISPDRPRGVVTASEWRIIFQDGTRWFGTYLKFANLQGKYSDWTRGEGRSRLALVVGEAISLAERVVNRHCPKGESLPGGGCAVAPGIPFKLVVEVMENLEWDGTIAGVHFKKNTLKKLIEPFFQHLFGGTDPTETGRTATRITYEHLERVRGLIREWVDGARYLEGLYAKLLRDPAFPSDAMITTQDILKVDVRSILKANGGVTDAAVIVADGLRGSFAHTSALLDQESRGAIFDGKNKTRARVYRELVRYTWLKPLLKVAVVGYMAGPNMSARERMVADDGLTLPEFTKLLEDYWQLLVDFKMVGPNNMPVKDAKSRFREAALFTQVSDGSELISIEEGVQVVLYMLSSNPVGDEVHERAIKLCQPVGPPDDYDEPTIEPKCYRQNIFDFASTNRNGADLWTQFPILIKFYDDSAKSGKDSFRENIERAVRKPWLKAEDYFGSDESDSMPMMFHYIEALFMRFDTGTNGVDGVPDGFIDKAEAKVAFPVFKNQLAEMSGMDPSDPKLRSVFYYLLANGNPPVSDTMGSWRRFWRSAGFLWWHVTQPRFKASRLDLLEVFATLSSSPSAVPPSAVPPPAVPTSQPRSTWSATH